MFRKTEYLEDHYQLDHAGVNGNYNR